MLQLKVFLVGLCSIPFIGLWNRQLILSSSLLQIGYRHIDCAQIYGNEKEVNKTISASVVWIYSTILKIIIFIPLVYHLNNGNKLLYLLQNLSSEVFKSLNFFRYLAAEFC